MAFQPEPEFAVTPIQAALLSESGLSARPWVNIEQIVVQFGNDPVTSNQIRAGLVALAQRYDALRLIIRQDETGRLRQKVEELSTLPFEVRKNADASEASRDQQIKAFLTEDRRHGFALDGSVLWRASLLVWDTAQPVLVLTFHHAIVDGRSMAQLTRALLDFLKTGQLQPETEDIASFSALCRAITDKVPNAEGAAQYFATYLAKSEDTGTLTLPYIGNLEPDAKHKRQITRTLSVDQSTNLRQVAEKCDATLANIVQGGWGLLLARWQGAETVTFGVVRSGRHAIPNCQDTIGCLINTLPTCVTLDHDLTLSGMLAPLRKHMLALRPFEQTPAELIRRATGLHGAKRLFETAIMFENAGMEQLVLGESPTQNVEAIELREEGGMPLMLSVYAEDAIKILFEYDPSIVAPVMADRMFENLVQLLGRLSRADADTRIADIDMLGNSERQTLLEWAKPDTSLDAVGTCLVRKFRQVVESAPDAVALEHIGQDETLTFAQLDHRTDKMANALAANGARAGTIVAVNLARSFDFVVAVIATLKAGAAFMPVDPAHPDAVQAHMITNSAADITVRDGRIESNIERTTRTDPGVRPLPCPDEDTNELAYVIYTSGSTGTPKGVEVSRGNLLAHLGALMTAFGTTPKDRCLQFAGLSFDVAIEEVFTALMAGATVVLRDEEMAQSASTFLDKVDREEITLLNIPTAFWTVLTGYLQTSGRSLPTCVRLVVVGGERIPPQVLAQWQALAPGPQWLNGYGPTETTITCTLFEPTSGQAYEEVPIGRPTAHARAYILAPDGSLAPQSAVGELVIGGPAVSRGYIGLPHETAQVFRPNAPAQTGRVYRTGDRAQWLTDGNLRFLGRQDRQIKLRGHRIELGHIERTVQDCVTTAEVLCDVLDKDMASAQLVAWIACADQPDMATLAQAVAAKLPTYMRPTLVHLTEFPRTPNQKIDRAALPAPIRAHTPNTQVASEASALVAQICLEMAEVLNLTRVEPDQSFFDLGGHSLLSIEFIGRIEIATGKKLGFVDFHDNPSPRALSYVLQGEGDTAENIVPIQPDGHKAPVFAIHILGANEEYFRPLAQHLGGDQPVIGISIGSMNEDTPTGVEFTASRYCKAINDYQPEGLVHLMAASLGSYIAFELARQLKDSGRKVGMLAFFDATGPDDISGVTGIKKVSAYATRARYAGWGYPLVVVKNRIHNWRTKLAVRQINDTAEPDKTQVPRTVFEFIAANEMAVQNYTPQPIDIPLTIFRSKGSVFDTDEVKVNGLGWASVAQAGFQVINVPGGHLTMLQEPFVATLAKKIQGALGRADDQND